MGLKRKLEIKMATNITSPVASNKPSATIVKQTDRDRNKAIATSNMIREKAAKYPTGSYEETYCIDSQVLMMAPKHYFAPYQNKVREITDKIQDSLSRSGNAGVIDNVKRNPLSLEAKKEAFSYINNEFLKIDGEDTSLEYRNFDNFDKKIILALVVNEICGLGPLEPLFRNENVKEIIANGPNDIQADFPNGLQKCPSCRFRSIEHLENLITRLYDSVGKTVSRTNPFDNARLPDKSRLFVTDKIMAPDGPNLNIRRHPKHWTTPEQLLEWDSISKEMLTWLGQRINAGLSILVHGGTSTGKTTLLSALSGYYPNNQRIVTIEKNIELKIPRNKLKAAALECIAKKTTSSNSLEVTMRDLVVCCTQMRPDIIICGEIVGQEAYDFIQAANTGHVVATTVHANTPESAVSRLMSLITQADLIKGKDTVELISEGIDLVVTAKRFPEDGSRKIVQISEIGTPTIDEKSGQLVLPVVPIWVFKQDPFNIHSKKVTGTWQKVGGLSQERRDKHRLDYRRLLTFDELREVYMDGFEEAYND